MEKIKDNDLKHNSEGYPDPTAYKAIKSIDKENKINITDEEYNRFHKVIDTIYNVCALSGFHIAERIILIDKTNGRVWK